MKRLFRLPWRSGRRIDADVDDELRFHLDARVADLVAAGVPPDAARARAAREFGDLDDARRYLRALDRRTEHERRQRETMRELWRDIVYGLRKMRAAPGFTATAIATIAIGIGANTAVFSVVYAALLRPLPYPNADRIVGVMAEFRGERWVASPPDFTDWRAQSRSFSAMAAMNAYPRTLTGVGDPQAVPAASVTGDFFSVFGVAPALGRAFDADEMTFGHAPTVVLSDRLWRRAFGARRDIVGQSIQLDGKTVQVVGIMPAGFAYPTRAQLWTPLAFSANDLATQRGAHYLEVVARLRPQVNAEAAARDVGAVAARLSAAFPRTNKGHSTVVVALRDTLIGATPRRALLVLLGAVALVTLIACANVANLLLARGAARRHELAVRVALGASPGNLLRTALTESVLLALFGGAVGLALGALAVRGLTVLRPAALQDVGPITIDFIVLAFTLGASIVTGLAFGIVPAAQTMRADGLHAALQSSSRTDTAGMRTGRMRTTLVAAELALSVLLLVGAGLLIKSFVRLQNVPRGFDPRGVLTFGVSLPDARYPKPSDAATFYQSMTAQLDSLPDVDAAAGMSIIPLDGDGYQISVMSLDGQPIPDADQPSPQIRIVTPAAFRALGIRIVRGRMFGDADRAGQPRVVLVNERAARLLWPSGDALGHRMEIGTKFGLGGERAGGEVVGIVADVHDAALGVPPQPTVYLAHAQFPVSDLTAVVRVRADVDPLRLVPAVRSVVKRLDPQLPLNNVQPMTNIESASVAQPRFVTLLLASFAFIAMVLALVGVYGVMAYLVGQRTREFGIRIALGASRRAIVASTLGRAAKPIVLGLGVGMAGAALLTRTMERLLYEVQPTDPATFLAVPCILATVALVAAYVPARRAREVDPVIALRGE
jgi:predicted permease